MTSIRVGLRKSATPVPACCWCQASAQAHRVSVRWHIGSSSFASQRCIKVCARVQLLLRVAVLHLPAHGISAGAAALSQSRSAESEGVGCEQGSARSQEGSQLSLNLCWTHRQREQAPSAAPCREQVLPGAYQACKCSAQDKAQTWHHNRSHGVPQPAVSGCIADGQVRARAEHQNRQVQPGSPAPGASGCGSRLLCYHCGQ